MVKAKTDRSRPRTAGLPPGMKRTGAICRLHDCSAAEAILPRLRKAITHRFERAFGRQSRWSKSGRRASCR